MTRRRGHGSSRVARVRPRLLPARGAQADRSGGARCSHPASNRAPVSSRPVAHSGPRRPATVRSLPRSRRFGRGLGTPRGLGRSTRFSDANNASRNPFPRPSSAPRPSSLRVLQGRPVTSRRSSASGIPASMLLRSKGGRPGSRRCPNPPRRTWNGPQSTPPPAPRLPTRGWNVPPPRFAGILPARGVCGRAGGSRRLSRRRRSRRWRRRPASLSWAPLCQAP